MKTATKKTRKPAVPAKPKRPTYAELTEQRDNLRRKVWLLRKVLAGEAADLELLNACGVTGSDTPEARDIKGGALRRCTYALDYVMRGEG